MCQGSVQLCLERARNETHVVSREDNATAVEPISNTSEKSILGERPDGKRSSIEHFGIHEQSNSNCNFKSGVSFD